MSDPFENPFTAPARTQGASETADFPPPKGRPVQPIPPAPTGSPFTAPRRPLTAPGQPPDARDTADFPPPTGAPVLMHPPVPNGPLTPAAAPVYGPAPHRYGEPPPPTYGPVPSPTDTSSTRRAPALPVDYAHWGRRVPAYLIDFAPSIVAAIVLGVAYVMFFVALLSTPTDGDEAAVANAGAIIVVTVIGLVALLASLAWVIHNRWITAGETGQSLGKRVMQLHLISEQTGEPIGPFNAFIRDLVHILDGLAYVGYLWPLWDDKRQTFADMIMQTLVIDDRMGTAPDQRRAS